MDAMQMFVNFRGREPEIEPLLRNSGLLTVKEDAKISETHVKK
jgi:hypothetical protein